MYLPSIAVQDSVQLTAQDCINHAEQSAVKDTVEETVPADVNTEPSPTNGPIQDAVKTESVAQESVPKDTVQTSVQDSAQKTGQDTVQEALQDSVGQVVTTETTVQSVGKCVTQDIAPVPLQVTIVTPIYEPPHREEPNEDSINLIYELKEFSNEEISRYIERSFAFWKEKEAELFDI
jgi:hypothetical protein